MGLKLRLYLDDVRPTPDGYHMRAYNAPEAIAFLKTGLVGHISFDHDLGPKELYGDGYEVAKWIEEMAFKGELDRFTWQVHSSNGPGRQNITAAMRKATQFWDSLD